MDAEAAGFPADRLMALVALGLGRWFGPIGARALLARALAAAQAHHPALASVSVVPAARGTPPSSWVTGLAESARAHGTGPAADAVVAVIACLADLMGRLIGEQLAMTVLERSAAEPVFPEPGVPRPAALGPESPTPASPTQPASASPRAAGDDGPLTATDT